MIKPLFRRHLAVCAVISFCSLGAGCIESRPPLEPRFYLVPTSFDVPQRGEDGAPAVRISSVTSAAHIGERICWRLSDVEVAFDDENRWAADPRELVRDALEQACFAEGSLQKSTERRGAELSVHLEGFEGALEVKEARVVLRAQLSTQRDAAQFQHRVSLQRPLSATETEDLVRVLGELLEAAVTEVADWAEAELQQVKREAESN